MTEPMPTVSWFEDLSAEAIHQVGGKNASLGELIQHLKPIGVRVPAGFATTVQIYRTFLEANQLPDPIRARLEEFRRQGTSLAETGQRLRELILKARFPDATAAAITTAYRQLSQQYGCEAIDVAVRSSATAEDLPEASFAGQQETFLNIRGADALLKACQCCFASLFTDRALSYRENHGIDHLQVALSVGVQKFAPIRAAPE